MRAGKNVKVAQWSNSDGEFGVVVVDNNHTNWEDHVLMEIEMTPDELIGLATDILVMAQRKNGGPGTVPHSGPREE